MSLKKITAILLVALSLAACQKKTETKPAEPAEQKEKAEEKPAEQAEPESEDDKWPVPFVAEGPIAIVDGKEIPAEKFNKQLAPVANIAVKLPMDRLEMIKEDIVKKLIDDALINQRVADLLGKVSDEDLKEERDKFVAQFPSEEAFKKTLEQMNMTEEELAEQMKVAVALKQLIIDEYGAKVTDDDVKSFYKDNKEKFSHEKMVHARHILLNVKPDASKEEVDKVKAKAEEIAKEAKAKGADFAALAEKYSEGPTKSKGGDLGYFESGMMVPEFSKVAFGLKKGQVSEPVRTQFGFHVIKVEDIKPAGTSSLDDVKDNIQENLLMQKLGAGVEKLLNELREKAKIERKDGDNIKVNPKFAAAQEKEQKAVPGNGLPPGMPIGGPAGAPPAGDLKLKLNNE